MIKSGLSNSYNLLFEKLEEILIRIDLFLLGRIIYLKSNQRKVLTNQNHKNFSSRKIKSLNDSYIAKEIELGYILLNNSIRRSRFLLFLK